MEWPLMSPQELHSFGIEAIVPYIQKEGVTVESVNSDLANYPQIVGKRWGSIAFVVVRTACYPKKGELSPRECEQFLGWADKHGATAFFASVSVVCVTYPDKSEVHSEADYALPIRNGGFNIAYKGLLVLTTSDRVRVWPE